MGYSGGPLDFVWLESIHGRCCYLARSISVQVSPVKLVAVQGRFMRNQHQVLLRRLYHIQQTGTVEDYVQRFSDLIDRISAYDSHQDPLHYLTRFLDGLKPAVRVLVSIQKPDTLDEAASLALLWEELADGTDASSDHSNYSPMLRRPQPQHQLPSPSPSSAPPPPPPARWVSKSFEEKRKAKVGRTGTVDRWSSLKEYRRSKGLCYRCGERWGKDHIRNKSIHLHIVQEMLDCLQDPVDDGLSEPEEESPPQQHLHMLSTAAVSPQSGLAKSMKILVEIQGKPMTFLIDSGSSSCFIDSRHASVLAGRQTMDKIVQVKVAGGEIFNCTDSFQALTWHCQGHEFTDSFRVLELNSYDGIIGLDWLAQHSPTITHWAQQWLAFMHQGELTVIHGEGTPAVTHALLELHLVQHDGTEPVTPYSSEIQGLLQQFAEVFAKPVGLPPRRQYDHRIGLQAQETDEEAQLACRPCIGLDPCNLSVSSI